MQTITVKLGAAGVIKNQPASGNFLLIESMSGTVLKVTAVAKGGGTETQYMSVLSPTRFDGQFSNLQITSNVNNDLVTMTYGLGEKWPLAGVGGLDPVLGPATHNPFVMGMVNSGGSVEYAQTDDNKGLDVLQYNNYGSNNIAGGTQLGFTPPAAETTALILVECTTAPTGPVNVAVESFIGGFNFQSQLLDINRVQTVAGAATYAAASAGTLTNLGDKLLILIRLSGATGLITHIGGADGLFQVTYSLSPVANV